MCKRRFDVADRPDRWNRAVSGAKSMLSILPLVLLCLAAAAWANWSKRKPVSGVTWDVRDALLVGAVVVGLWAAVGAEALSLTGHLIRTPVIGWWLLPVSALTVWLVFHPMRPGLARLRADRDWLVLTLFSLAIIMLGATCVIALLTPPTTPDCLTYHMPRQVYWMHNRCVDLYPSRDLRQLEMPPLAEYLGVHLMLLSGTDHQANMIQWFAFLLGALAASTIVRDLGGGARAQAFAAILTLLNPASVAQAVNPKNDLVVALWALILLSVAVRTWTRRGLNWGQAILGGTTLGLLLLTKGTAYIVAPPVCAVIGIAALGAGWRKAVPMGACMVVIAVAINTPHWVRNATVFGSPLGLAAERGGFGLANETHTFAAITSNIVRNLTLHTNSPLKRFNAWQERRVRRLHERLGIDSSDDRTTSPHIEEYAVVPTWKRDGWAAAPVHLVLAIAMLALVRPGRLRKRPAWPVFLIPYACAFLFVLLLKWQPWHARLHIPLVAIAAPMMAVSIQRRPIVMVLASGLAAIPAVCMLLWNENKPLVGENSVIGKPPEEVRFQTHPFVLLAAREAVDRLSRLKPATVALDIQPYTCEYPLMNLILDRVEPTPRLEVFDRYYGPVAKPSAPPDAAFVYRPGAPGPIIHTPSGMQMSCVSDAGNIRLYVPNARIKETQLLVPAPKFIGWNSESGLQPAEGPYPEFDLPAVRWADQRSMTLTFQSDGGPMILVMECRRNDRSDQVMTVMLNSLEVIRFEFGDAWRFVPLRIPLPAQPGLNTLMFDFANANEPGPPRSALFRRLQIIPESWMEQPGTELPQP